MAVAGAPRKQFGSVSASSAAKLLRPKQLDELMEESNTNPEDSDSSLSLLTFPFPCMYSAI